MNFHRFSISWGVLTAILFFGIVAGCSRDASGQTEDSRLPDTPLLPTSSQARELLRIENAALEEYIIERMRIMNAAAVSSAADRKTRGRVQDWSRFGAQRTSRLLENEEPLAGLLDLWALTAQMEKYVREGKGRRRYGVAQVLVRDATDDILNATRAAVDAYLSPEAYATAEANIKSYIEKNSIDYGSTFISRLWNIRKVPFSVVEAGKNTVMTVAAIPLMPKRTGDSLRRGTEELHDFNETAYRFTDVVENLPRRARHEMEILLENLDDRSSTISLITSDLQQFSSEIDSSFDTAERMTPELQQLSSQIDTSLNTVERMAPEVQTAIDSVDVSAQSLGETAESIESAAAELRLLVDALDEFMQEVRDDAKARGPEAGGSGTDPAAFTEAAQAIESGSAEVRLLVEQIENLIRPPNRKPRDPDYHRFDIREYTEAAHAIGVSSTEVRGILSDLNAAAGDEELKQSSSELLEKLVDANDRIGDRTESLVRHVLVLLAIFFTFLAALFTAYRLVQIRYAPRPRPAP